jgi:diacylglycerol O-acyltransferase
VRALNGADAFHLRREDDGQPSHTIKLAVLAPGDGSLDADELAAWAAASLPERAPFRWRLQPVPVGLGRPVWVDAEAVDPAQHVRRHTLTGSDLDGALDDFVGALAGQLLERDRPLWRLWVVDGLDRERVALVLQLHHALADGAASVQIWEEVFAEDPPTAPRTASPGASALVLAVLGRHVRSLRELPSLLGRLRASSAARKELADSSPVIDYFEAPATRFNGALSADRACTFVALGLDDLRSIGRRLGGTLNDVYAAVCGGAARAYLNERGELPNEPLTATAPSALERLDGDGYGNSMTSWFWCAATDREDPLDRFRIVRDSLAAARDLQQKDPRLLADLQDHSGLYETIWWFLARAERRRDRPMLNLIVSNVRGPEPLAWRGHPVVALQSIGPLTGRMGLNFTAWSYGGDFTIGLHACRDQMPDLPRLAQLLVDEVDLLWAAAAD